ncbi:MAG: TetR/AcrR family transcriptional regulator [Pseudomonadota bacterium]
MTEILSDHPAERTAARAGNIKVTREDWLRLAMQALIAHGVEGVKIQLISEKLGVSRSSFYWYFKSRADLLDALFDHWHRTNTKALIDMAERPAETITEAVGNVFRCALDPTLFDVRLDFAIRDWARRAPEVREKLHASENRRLEALTAMFAHFGYAPLDATTRARILYYMQTGYDDAQLAEPLEERNRLLPAYLRGFTGVEPRESEIQALRAFARATAGQSEQ